MAAAIDNAVGRWVYVCKFPNLGVVAAANFVQQLQKN